MQMLGWEICLFLVPELGHGSLDQGKIAMRVPRGWKLVGKELGKLLLFQGSFE